MIGLYFHTSIGISTGFSEAPSLLLSLVFIVAIVAIVAIVVVDDDVVVVVDVVVVAGVLVVLLLPTKQVSQPSGSTSHCLKGKKNGNNETNGWEKK